MAPQSRLEYHQRRAAGDTDFYKERALLAIKQLESNLDGIKVGIENNWIPDILNFVGKTGDVVDYLSKLQGALQRREALKDIAEDDGTDGYSDDTGRFEFIEDKQIDVSEVPD
jgi:hypothetical protein